MTHNTAQSSQTTQSNDLNFIEKAISEHAVPLAGAFVGLLAAGPLGAILGGISCYAVKLKLDAYAQSVKATLNPASYFSTWWKRSEQTARPWKEKLNQFFGLQTTPTPAPQANASSASSLNNARPTQHAPRTPQEHSAVPQPPAHMNVAKAKAHTPSSIEAQQLKELVSQRTILSWLSECLTKPTHKDKAIRPKMVQTRSKKQLAAQTHEQSPLTDTATEKALTRKRRPKRTRSQNKKNTKRHPLARLRRSKRLQNQTTPHAPEMNKENVTPSTPSANVPENSNISKKGMKNAAKPLALAKQPAKLSQVVVNHPNQEELNIDALNTLSQQELITLLHQAKSALNEQVAPTIVLLRGLQEVAKETHQESAEKRSQALISPDGQLVQFEKAKQNTINNVLSPMPTKTAPSVAREMDFDTQDDRQRQGCWSRITRRLGWG